MGKVMIIEDDDLIRNSTGRILTMAGHTVFLKPDTDGADDIIDDMDFVLCDNDLGIGKEKGLEFALRNKGRARICIYSGRAEVVDDALASGLLALSKPASIETLRAMVAG